MTNIAFIGIGNMGWPMAANLARAGHFLRIYDAAEGRACAFASEFGAEAAKTIGDVSANAEVVITMLPTSRHVDGVVRTIKDQLPPGATVIEMSSGSPDVTRQLGADLATGGVCMIDAPVSGGVERARAGSLAILVGGEPATIDLVRPILDIMGSSVHRVGDIGAGQAMKALNNLVSAGGFLIGIEALLIGKAFGLDPSTMVDALNASTGMNNSTKAKFKQFVLSRQFNSGFGLDLMVKDLGIALEVAHGSGIGAPFSAVCLELARAAAKLLGPGQDHTSFAVMSEKLAGLSLEPNAAAGDSGNA